MLYSNIGDPVLKTTVHIASIGFTLRKALLRAVMFEHFMKKNKGILDVKSFSSIPYTCIGLSL